MKKTKKTCNGKVFKGELIIKLWRGTTNQKFKVEIEYDSHHGFTNKIEDLVRKTTDTVFVEQRNGLEEYFMQFERQDNSALDYLTTRSASKMQQVFHDSVLRRNQDMYDQIISKGPARFPSDVIENFIRHKTECQIFDLYKKGNKRGDS